MIIVRTISRHRMLFTVAGLLAAVTMSSRPPWLSAQPPSLPAPVGYVNDFAGVIPDDARARLDDLAKRLNAATRGDMVVVTLPDLGGRPVEETALRLGRGWKVGAQAQIGDQARNAGIIILIVPKESASDGRGRCRIEVGQGAEAFITDATAGSLCREVTSQFQARDYGGAIEYLAVSIADRYAANFGVTLDGQPRARRRLEPAGGGGDLPSWLPLLIVILVFVVLPMMSRRRRGCLGCLPIPIPGPGGFGGGFGGGGFGGGFGGGGGGGGFGGFGGGGGFSGGGGGSDW